MVSQPDTDHALRRLTLALGAAVLVAGVVAACMPRIPVPAAPLPITPWTPHVPLRGMDLSPKTPLGPMDYQALDVVQPGSVVLFSAQLGDGDPLQARLPGVSFFVTECGRRPLASNGQPDVELGSELVDFSARTRASIVAPFVPSSPGGSFDQFDFVDREGNLRPHLFAWGALGP